MEWEFHDNVAIFLGKLTEHVAKNMETAALVLGDQHRENLSVGFPPASMPGQFPAMRTGNLRDSVIINPPTAADIMRTRYVDIMYDDHGFYGYILISGRFNRLGIVDTFQDMKEELRAVLMRPMP